MRMSNTSTGNFYTFAQAPHFAPARAGTLEGVCHVSLGCCILGCQDPAPFTSNRKHHTKKTP